MSESPWNVASPSPQFVPCHELWRRHYRENRYARHLNRSELAKRIRDIFLNLLMLSPKGKIGLPPISPSMDVWMQKWTHVLEEMALRYGPYPAGMDRDILHSEPFPNLASELGQRAAVRLGSLGVQRSDVFVKLGKRQYMEMLHREGRLRVQPASFFSNTVHNSAIRDDELTMPISIALSRAQVVQLVRNPHDVPADAPEHRIDVEFAFRGDFWLYCVSNTVSPRHFVDFDAEACVIIRNRAAFRSRLVNAARAVLPEANMHEGDAVYIDPLLPKSSNIFIPVAKHFGYTYQDEYRFCWIPPQSAILAPRADRPPAPTRERPVKTNGTRSPRTRTMVARPGPLPVTGHRTPVPQTPQPTYIPTPIPGARPRSRPTPWKPSPTAPQPVPNAPAGVRLPAPRACATSTLGRCARQALTPRRSAPRIPAANERRPTPTPPAPFPPRSPPPPPRSSSPRPSAPAPPPGSPPAPAR